MNELRATIETPTRTEPVASEVSATDTKPEWETPKLEDVSEQVMAQPYIRFT